MDFAFNDDGLPARPPRYDPVTGELSDAAALIQLDHWRALLDWEATNPQQLDAAVLLKRMQYTYNCSLVCFRPYPEVWYGLTASCRKGAISSPFSGNLRADFERFLGLMFRWNLSS